MDDNVYPVVIQSANKLTFDQFFDDTIMSDMMEERRQELNKTLVVQYGIEVADIGIYRKNFPQSNIASIEKFKKKANVYVLKEMLTTLNRLLKLIDVKKKLLLKLQKKAPLFVLKQNVKL